MHGKDDAENYRGRVHGEQSGWYPRKINASACATQQDAACPDNAGSRKRLTQPTSKAVYDAHRGALPCLECAIDDVSKMSNVTNP